MTDEHLDLQPPARMAEASRRLGASQRVEARPRVARPASGLAALAAERRERGRRSRISEDVDEVRPRQEPSAARMQHTAPKAKAPLSTDARIALLEAENAALRAQLDATTSESEVVVLDDERVLQEVGIYRYHHPLENASLYKDRLNELSTRIAELVKTKAAIEMSSTFTFDNSLAKGQKMASDLGKLMLRAYNAEVDNSLRSLRVGNVVTAKNDELRPRGRRSRSSAP